MDGTLADVSGIRHFVVPTPERPYKAFHEFHAASVDVPPNDQAVSLLHQARADGLAILVVLFRNRRSINVQELNTMKG